MANELLDIKNLAQQTEISDEDRILVTLAANAHKGASCKFSDFRTSVVQPIIDGTVPEDLMSLVILESQEEYDALPEVSASTMYIIISGGTILSVYLGELFIGSSD